MIRRRRGARFLLAAAALLLSVAPAAAQSPAEPSPEEIPLRAHDAAADANAAKARADAARRDEQALDAERQRLANALAQLGPRIVARETALFDAQERLAALRLDLAMAQGRLDETLSRLRTLLAAMQKAAREPTPSLLIHPDRPVDAARSALLMRRFAERLRATTDAARAEYDRIAEVEAEARRVEEAARADLAALRADDAEVRALLAQKQDALSQASAAAQSAAADAARLAEEAETLAGLAAAVAQSPSLAPAPLAPSEPPPAEPPDAAIAAPADPAPPESDAAGAAPLEGIEIARAPKPVRRAPQNRPKFARAKGEVLRPVAGRLQRPTGADEAHGRGGVYFITNPYARVISPWDGTVRFAETFPSYGRVVIIEPQTDYLVLLTGLAEVTLDVGERVIAGEPIGRMGGPPPTSNEFLFEISSTTRETREQLYFEIRHKGDAIDPEPWLRPETGKATGL